jgi:DNA primase
MADNTIQEIKDRLDVATVVGRYVQLKKSGTNFKGLCPFHHEKSGSFMVSSQKQIWHCFGCGEGGDVIGFIKRYENIEFREALVMAAEMAGVELPNNRVAAGPDKSVIEELIKINDFAASYFQKALATKQGEVAKKYILDRGLTSGTIDLWRIGFAPNSFDGLVNAVQSKKIKLSQAVAAGVLVENDRKKIFDRFRDRLTFPIFDINGQVVAFTARVLPGAKDDQAKYINSPETTVYNKSKIIFGLNFAKTEIRARDQVVIVEGQMDCISAHQAGFLNTIATSGTALTEQHMRTLKRFTSTVALAFDNDDAGRKAQHRASLIALGLEMEVRIVDLQQAKDPDELIRKSPGVWEKLVKGSLRVIEYYIEQAKQKFPAGSLEQKQYIIETILPLVNQIKSPVENDHYYQKLSVDFGVSEQALRTEISEPSQKAAEEPRQTAVPLTQDVLWEKEILGGMAQFPEFLSFVREEGLPEQLLTPELVEHFQNAILGQDISGSNNPLVKEALFMVESSLDNLSNNELALIRELKKSFYQFKLAKLKHYLQELTIALKKAELEKNTTHAKQLNAKFAQLTNTRFEIETKLREA